MGHWRSSKVFVYLVVNLAVFTDAYFYGVIIPVLPFALTDVIHVEEHDVQWWIGALLAAYGAGLLVGSRMFKSPSYADAKPIIGYYADQSRKGPYLLGLVFLMLSTIAISVGRRVEVLVVGRLVQGLSSASVHAVGMAILADTAGEGMGPAMGLVTTMMCLGAVLGPMFGGLLYHRFGYFAVFLSAYVLVAADFVLRLLMVEKRRTKTYGTFDVKPTPISVLLTAPRMLAAILCDFMQSVILTGLETILPLRIKTIFNYNSQDVALVFLVLALPYAAGPLTGKLGDMYGAKAVVSFGFASLMPLIIMLRQINHEQVVLLCILLFAIGTAMNMVLTPAWSDTVYLVQSMEGPAYAQAFGLLNMAYAVGSVLGPLMGGWLVEEVGWNQLTLGAGIACGVCVIPCMMYTGGRRQESGKDVAP